MSQPHRAKPIRIDLPDGDPLAEWYSIWCAAREAQRAAEAAERARSESGVGWLVIFLVGWSLAAAIAGGVALALWTGA